MRCKSRFWALLLLLALVCFTLSGCIEGHLKLGMNRGGSVDMEIKLINSQGVDNDRFVKDVGAKLKEYGWSARPFTPADGDKDKRFGAILTKHLDNITDINFERLFEKAEPKGSFVRKQEGWLFDYYSIGTPSRQRPESIAPDKSMVTGVKPKKSPFTIIVSLPGNAIAHNAVFEEGGGKTLVWNTDARAQDMPLQVQFKVWNMGMVCLAVALLLALGGGAFVLWKKCNTPDMLEEKKKHYKLLTLFAAGLCAAVLLGALISVSANPPAFNAKPALASKKALDPNDPEAKIIGTERLENILTYYMHLPEDKRDAFKNKLVGQEVSFKNAVISPPHAGQEKFVLHGPAGARCYIDSVAKNSPETADSIKVKQIKYANARGVVTDIRYKGGMNIKDAVITAIK